MFVNKSARSYAFSHHDFVNIGRFDSRCGCCVVVMWRADEWKEPKILWKRRRRRRRWRKTNTEYENMRHEALSFIDVYMVVEWRKVYTRFCSDAHRTAVTSDCLAVGGATTCAYAKPTNTNIIHFFFPFITPVLRHFYFVCRSDKSERLRRRNMNFMAQHNRSRMNTFAPDTRKKWIHYEVVSNIQASNKPKKKINKNTLKLVRSEYWPLTINGHWH